MRVMLLVTVSLLMQVTTDVLAKQIDAVCCSICVQVQAAAYQSNASLFPLRHQMFVPNAPLPSISPSGHARCSVFGFCSGCCAAAHRRLDTRRHSAPSVRPHTPSYIPIHITRCMYPRLQNVVATAFLGTPLNLPEVVQRLDNIE